MRRPIHFILSLTTLSLAALLGAACDREEDNWACTQVGCGFDNELFNEEKGVHVVLENAANVFSPSFPVTVSVCVEGDCGEVTLKDEAGTTVCAVEDAELLRCEIRNDGSVMIAFATPLTGASVSIQTVAKDSAGATLFDETGPAAIEKFSPNGDGCGPICLDGTITHEVPNVVQ